VLLWLVVVADVAGGRCCCVLPSDVVGVGHDVDLALLTVEDEDFWLGTEGPMKPLQLGDVPQLQVCECAC
jgi:hypothetical protein